MGKKPRQITHRGCEYLEKEADIKDKYLIYKKNNSLFIHDPDSVLKSSQTMSQIGVKMDQGWPESPLQGEETYFNWLHL